MIRAAIFLCLVGCTFDQSGFAPSRFEEGPDGGVEGVETGDAGIAWTPADAADPIADPIDAGTPITPPDASPPDALGLPLGAVCSLWEQNCAPGLACNWFSGRCEIEGTRANGELCTGYLDCQIGLVCIGSPAGNRCRELCRVGSDTCSMGSCHPIGAGLGDPEAGTCQ